MVETSDNEKLPGTDTEVGIDLGLASFAVLSDGKVIESQKFLRKAERRLRKANKALSRKEKGSKNRTKARLVLAKAHAHVKDARRDFHHKASTTIIRENTMPLACRARGGIRRRLVRERSRQNTSCKIGT